MSEMFYWVLILSQVNKSCYLMGSQIYHLFSDIAWLSFFFQGWCSTCNPKALPGNLGHCPDPFKGVPEEGKQPGTVEGEFGLPVSLANWGWCSQDCIHRDDRPVHTEVLMTTKLEVNCEMFTQVDENWFFGSVLEPLNCQRLMSRWKYQFL